MSRVLQSLTVLCFLLSFAGCGGQPPSGGSPPNPMAPAITTQPANRTVTAGLTATFTVAASGTGPLNYQWQRNGSTINGATADRYSTPITVGADSGAQFPGVLV